MDNSNLSPADKAAIERRINIMEIEDASMMNLLEEALYKAGLTQEEVEKIFYKNVLRVYKEVL